MIWAASRDARIRRRLAANCIHLCRNVVLCPRWVWHSTANATALFRLHCRWATRCVSNRRYACNVIPRIVCDSITDAVYISVLRLRRTAWNCTQRRYASRRTPPSTCPSSASAAFTLTFCSSALRWSRYLHSDVFFHRRYPTRSTPRRDWRIIVSATRCRMALRRRTVTQRSHLEKYAAVTPRCVLRRMDSPNSLLSLRRTPTVRFASNRWYATRISPRVVRVSMIWAASRKAFRLRRIARKATHLCQHDSRTPRVVVRTITSAIPRFLRPSFSLRTN